MLQQRNKKKANFHILNKSYLFRLSDHTKQDTFNYNDRFKEVLWIRLPCHQRKKNEMKLADSQDFIE